MCIGKYDTKIDYCHVTEYLNVNWKVLHFNNITKALTVFYISIIVVKFKLNVIMLQTYLKIC